MEINIFETRNKEIKINISNKKEKDLEEKKVLKKEEYENGDGIEERNGTRSYNNEDKNTEIEG